ncbi:hypothetical protein P2318_13900 [Myxococcaceae bacterium GXIMD 01537]
MRTAVATRTTVQSRTREALPAALIRELDSATLRARTPGERPASIKDAIIRWLNEEL